MTVKDTILAIIGSGVIALLGYGLHMNDRVVVLETRMESVTDMKESQKTTIQLMSKMDARLSVMEALLEQQIKKDK